MAQAGDKTIPIQCHIIAAPTHKKAFLAGFRDSEGTPLGKSWLPYSRVKLTDGREVVGMENGAEIEIALPKWLADQEDTAELIREQILEQEAGVGRGELDYSDVAIDDDDIPF